jgi:hypothetical protein
MPDRLKLLIVLAAFVGRREGELLDLRRTDVDDLTGRISVTRKVDKDTDPSVRGACPECGRHISTRRPGAAAVRPRPAALPPDAAAPPARARGRGRQGPALPRLARPPAARTRRSTVCGTPHSRSPASMVRRVPNFRPAPATPPRQRWRSTSTPPATATRRWPCGSARRTTTWRDSGGRSDCCVGASRQICGSAS